MASPVKLYQKEMYDNLGLFATWLPGSSVGIGDVGILEFGRFIKLTSLRELGIPQGSRRIGSKQNMNYTAAVERSVAATAQAGVALDVADTSVHLRFTRQGGYVFEAIGMLNIELTQRTILADQIVAAHERSKWSKEWLLIDSICTAESATIIVSEESGSEMVLKAHAALQAGMTTLADPSVKLSISSSKGRIVQIVSQSNVTPLYSCAKLHVPFLGDPSLRASRGSSTEFGALANIEIDYLLAS